MARGGAGAAQRLGERGAVEVEDKRVSCVYVRGRNLSARVEERSGGGGMAWSTGVSLSKDLMAIAGGALKTNITMLRPLVLPFSELLLFFATLAAKKLFNAMVKPCIPDFQLTFEHFCIHAGGRAVLDEQPATVGVAHGAIQEGTPVGEPDQGEDMARNPWADEILRFPMPVHKTIRRDPGILVTVAPALPVAKVVLTMSKETDRGFESSTNMLACGCMKMMRTPCFMLFILLQLFQS